MNQALEGFLACLISSLFFGSMFVPIRRHNAGDGFFAQWVMCAAIFLVGMIVNAYNGFSTFHPLAMIGGVLWGLGNATAIPVMSTIGMGTCILICGTTNCITGWATSRFGLFGLKKEIPSNIPLNYVGLACVVIGGILFSRIKSRPHNAQVFFSNDDYQDTRHLVDNDEDEGVDGNRISLRTLEGNKTLLAIIISLISGLFYGCTFVPVIYMQQHPDKFKDVSPRGISYVFAMYCGIFVTSTTLLFFYTLYKRNRPFVNRDTILPAFVTGGMWAIAQISWFIANDRLSQAVSFPIICMVPGICAAAWSVFYFREIEDRRSLQILALAVITTLTGAVCVGLSKVF